MKLSYSEASTLSHCEQQWAYKYQDRLEDRPGRGLQLGTLLHAHDAAWLAGRGGQLPVSWVDEYNGETRWLEDFPTEIVDDAEWLVGRWAQHYGEGPPESWEIISSEQWLRFDYFDCDIVMRLDGLVRTPEGLWVREVKSYGRNSRLDIVEVSPQETIYVEGVRRLFGERPVGIIFDGIYTYRWQKERPVEDSFQRIWTDRTEAQIERALDWLVGVMERRAVLEDGEKPILNIGPLCRACQFRAQCYQDNLGLGAGDDEIEVEL